MGVFLSKNESWIRRTIPNDVFILNLKKLEIIMHIRNLSLLTLSKIPPCFWGP